MGLGRVLPPFELRVAISAHSCAGNALLRSYGGLSWSGWGDGWQGTMKPLSHPTAFFLILFLVEVSLPKGREILWQLAEAILMYFRGYFPSLFLLAKCRNPPQEQSSEVTNFPMRPSPAPHRKRVPCVLVSSDTAARRNCSLHEKRQVIYQGFLVHFPTNSLQK